MRILILPFSYSSNTCGRRWCTSLRTYPLTPTSKSSSILFDTWHMLYTSNFNSIIYFILIETSESHREPFWAIKWKFSLSPWNIQVTKSMTLWCWLSWWTLGHKNHVNVTNKIHLITTNWWDSHEFDMNMTKMWRW